MRDGEGIGIGVYAHEVVRKSKDDMRSKEVE
jgi:hypothetical protein